MLRILVVGHGLIGRQRAAAVAALAGQPSARCVLAGTVDPNPRDPKLYAGVPHYASFDSVPPQSYDAAIIAVPHNLAAGIAQAILRSKRPILIEKPLGMTGSEAHAIADLESGTPSFVGYNYRFLPTFREAFRRLEAGDLGRLRSVDMLLGHGGHPRSAEGWKLRPELAGGGVILDPGVHLFDLLLCLDRSLTLRHVGATRGFWKTGIEEDVVVVMESKDVLATVRVSHIRWVNTFRVEIGGEAGYLMVEGRGGSYGPQQTRFGRRWGWDDGTNRTQRQTETVADYGPGNDSLEVELRAVVDRWTGAPPPAGESIGPATLADGVRIAELCDRMYAALCKLSQYGEDLASPT